MKEEASSAAMESIFDALVLILLPIFSLIGRTSAVFFDAHAIAEVQKVK